MQSSWTEFIEKFELAVDLEDSIRVHQDYIQSILDRCFLSDKMLRIKSVLSRILEMSVILLTIQNSNELPTIAERLDKLTQLELEFTKASQFLQTILTQMTKLAKLPFSTTLYTNNTITVSNSWASNGQWRNC